MKTMIEGLNALDPKNTKKDTTTPAFPCNDILERDENGKFVGVEVSTTGMTLRDYFAAKIVASIPQSVSGGNVGVYYPDQNKNFALAAYALADAMMEARSS